MESGSRGIRFNIDACLIRSNSCIWFDEELDIVTGSTEIIPITVSFEGMPHQLFALYRFQSKYLLVGNLMIVEIYL